MAEKKESAPAEKTVKTVKKVTKAADAPATKTVKTVKKVESTAATKAAPAKVTADDGTAKTKRILAVVFWVLAIACEVLAVLVIFKKIELSFLPYDAQYIALLVLDLAFVIIGAQFWKKANHMDPVSESKPLKFWLWNNMGVIVCCFAFIPFIILTLTNKDADAKTKKIASIVAAVALLLGVGFSYDWNPVSEEGLAQATQTLDGVAVYWTKGGSVYHLDQDCQHLNRSDELYEGDVPSATEAGKARLCKTCAKNFGLELGENGAVIGNVEFEEALEEVVEEVVEEAAEVPAA